ncbi:MAG: hypothetical protein WBC29_04355 [Candidatus Moraniibacteriota bacterium]
MGIIILEKRCHPKMMSKTARASHQRNFSSDREIRITSAPFLPLPYLSDTADSQRDFPDYRDRDVTIQRDSLRDEALQPLDKRDIQEISLFSFGIQRGILEKFFQNKAHHAPDEIDFSSSHH